MKIKHKHLKLYCVKKSGPWTTISITIKSIRAKIEGRKGRGHGWQIYPLHWLWKLYISYTKLSTQCKEGYKEIRASSTSFRFQYDYIRMRPLRSSSFLSATNPTSDFYFYYIRAWWLAVFFNIIKMTYANKDMTYAWSTYENGFMGITIFSCLIITSVWIGN